MEKKNFRLKLYNGVQVCTNLTIENEEEKYVIYRFLGSLRHANTLAEQLSVINEITHCRGYSKVADETYYYDTSTDYVEVRKSVYDSKRGVFKKGCVIDTLRWEEGKITSANIF